MKRSDFIKLMTTTSAGLALMGTQAFAKQIGELPNTAGRMPVLFIGHGSPMNAIENNTFTQALAAEARNIPTPKAILCISAHWLTKGTKVLGVAKPKMIYDMYGFPDELYKVNYPAPGSPDMAKKVQEIVTITEVAWDEEWGFDHGTWSIIRHMYPNADIPLFQLSIDYPRTPQYHVDLAKQLQQLRNKGVLIIGSGNVTHNLGNLDFSNINATPFDWAYEFDQTIKNYLSTQNIKGLIEFQSLGKIAKLAHPSPDHYFPLLYSSALMDAKDKVSYFYEAFQYGSLSMRCVRMG